MSEEKREPTLWTCDEGAERLRHTDMHEAIMEHVQNLDVDDPDYYPVKPGEKIFVYGHAPLELPDAKYLTRWGGALERVLEWLDEDHGDPEECTDPTEAMEAAELEFVTKVLAEYKCWACECVKQVDIDLFEWCKENEPEACAKETP